MSRNHLARALVLALAILLHGSTASSAATDAAGEENLSRAREVVQRLSRTLERAQTIRLNIETAHEVVQESGVSLEFGGARSVVLRRPDRLRVEAVRRDGHRSEFYFDGKNGTLSHPDARVFSSTEMGPTVDAALDMLEDELGVPMPSGDVLHSDLPKVLEEHIEEGFWVGTERLGGVQCDHVAFPTSNVDAQLWVSREEPAVILRMVLTYVNEPGRPRFRANFRDWSFGEDAPDGLFVFKAADGMEQVPFVAIGGKPSSATGSR